MTNPHAFNLGNPTGPAPSVNLGVHGPVMFTFKPAPQLMKDQDIKIQVFCTGGGFIGDTITVRVDRERDLNLPASAFAVQWMRNGTPISGQTARQYVITADDLACEIAPYVTDACGIMGTAIKTAHPEPAHV